MFPLPTTLAIVAFLTTLLPPIAVEKFEFSTVISDPNATTVELLTAFLCPAIVFVIPSIVFPLPIAILSVEPSVLNELIMFSNSSPFLTIFANSASRASFLTLYSFSTSVKLFSYQDSSSNSGTLCFLYSTSSSCCQVYFISSKRCSNFSNLFFLFFNNSEFSIYFSILFLYNSKLDFVLSKFSFVIILFEP